MHTHIHIHTHTHTHTNHTHTTHTGWDKQPFRHQYLSIFKFGRNRKLLEDICHEAMNYRIHKDRDKTTIYVLHQYGYRWVRALSRDRRPVDSVILDRYDVWCMMCSFIHCVLWCMMYDVWCMMYMMCMMCMMYDVYDVWWIMCMMYDVWCMMCGMMHDVWGCMYDVWGFMCACPYCVCLCVLYLCLLPYAPNPRVCVLYFTIQQRQKHF